MYHNHFSAQRTLIPMLDTLSDRANRSLFGALDPDATGGSMAVKTCGRQVCVAAKSLLGTTFRQQIRSDRSQAIDFTDITIGD